MRPGQVVEIEQSPASSSTAPAADSRPANGDEAGITWLSTPTLQNGPVRICEKLRSKCTPGASGGPSHRCHYWAFDEVAVVYRRRYHLRHVAIEVFLANGENHLITFDDPGIRQELFNRLTRYAMSLGAGGPGGGYTVEGVRADLTDWDSRSCCGSRCESAIVDQKSAFEDIQSFLNLSNPNSLTERWVKGESARLFRIGMSTAPTNESSRAPACSTLHAYRSSPV